MSTLANELNELLDAAAQYRVETQAAAAEQARRDEEARSLRRACEVARLRQLLDGAEARHALALAGLRPEECEWRDGGGELWGEIAVAPEAALAIRLRSCGEKVILALRMRALGFGWETSAKPEQLREAIVQGVARAVTAVEEEQRQAAERARVRGELVTVAERVAELAQVYAAGTAAYAARCRQWAEMWAAQLWEPWTLWRVRYVPRQEAGGQAGELEPETVWCLESPEEITAGLVQRGCAMVSEVENSREAPTSLRALWAVLDARPREFTAHDAGRAMSFHREYWAGPGGAPSVVNVPPFVLEAPADAPRDERPAWDATLAAWCEQVGQDPESALLRLARTVGADYLAEQGEGAAAWLVEAVLGE